MRFIQIITATLVYLVISSAHVFAAPIFKKTGYISSVKVSKTDAKLGTVNLSSEVRYKVRLEASKFPRKGRAKTLRIKITSFHVKNPLQSWLLVDSSRIRAKVDVIDRRSGKKEASFEASVNKFGLQGAVGAITAAMDNPIDVERGLASRIAQEIFSELYGEEIAEKMTTKKGSSSISAGHPRQYRLIKEEMKCKNRYESAKLLKDSDFEHSPKCKKYFKKKKS